MNRIKLLREEKNIYQKDLAQLLGVSVPAINYYENEKRAMDTDTAMKLADYFGVSVDFLLGKSDVRNPEKVDIKDIDMGFATGYKGLTDANKETLKNIMEGLLAKQELEDKTEDKKD